MRLLVFHGYLLRGTGSNVYNAALARVLVALGVEVHLLCQDRDAAELDFVDAVGRFDGDDLTVEVLREPVRCTAYLPDIGEVLPVYVADRYEGFEAVPLNELDADALDRYLDANVRAVRAVVERAHPDGALANHAVMGPAILARALPGAVPYAVKVHGSALEYVVRPYRERFLPFARAGLDPAACVLVGSRHTAESLWSLVGDHLRARTRLGPPGVDVEAFRPRAPAEAAERLRALADRLEGATAGWGGEAGAADALRGLDPGRDPVVAYVGKLIVSKGVDLLLAAWPLVVERASSARLCVVGFGTYRGALESFAEALAAGDLDELRRIAARGRELEGGAGGELSYLAAFLDGLEGARRERYREAGRAAAGRLVFTGRLEHEDLAEVLPACSAQVVPSTFPESFGMVAAEAAACGVLPLSAAHSGLAEVSAVLAPALPPERRELLAFTPGPGAVEEIAVKLGSWLSLPVGERAEASRGLAETARLRFGWEGVARGVLAASQGRLGELAEPPAASAPSGQASG